MMGSSHALSGAAAWTAATAVAPGAFGIVPLDPASVTAGAVVCAGAALLPDADHPSATIAHSIPVAGSAVAGAVGAATGGHRHGMHSLLAVAVVAACSWWLGTLWWQPTPELPRFSIGGTLAAVALTAFGTKVLRITRTWFNAWLVGLVAALALAWVMPEANGWLPLCVTLGYAIHLLGDMLTTGGVPLLWPFRVNPPKAVANAPLASRLWQRNGYFAVPVLGNTGSGVEAIVGFALGAYVFIILGTMWVQESALA